MARRQSPGSIAKDAFGPYLAFFGIALLYAWPMLLPGVARWVVEGIWLAITVPLTLVYLAGKQKQVASRKQFEQKLGIVQSGGTTLHLTTSGTMTLCQRPVTRSVADVFRPSEVTCRECKRRAGFG